MTEGVTILSTTAVYVPISIWLCIYLGFCAGFLFLVLISWIIFEVGFPWDIIGIVLSIVIAGVSAFLIYKAPGNGELVPEYTVTIEEDADWDEINDKYKVISINEDAGTFVLRERED